MVETGSWRPQPQDKRTPDHQRRRLYTANSYYCQLAPAAVPSVPILSRFIVHVLTTPLCIQLLRTTMAPLSRGSCECSLSCHLQGKHDKEKPWDHESINHWEVQRFSKEDNPTGLLEESSFAILFPKYRGEAAQTPAMLHSLHKHKIYMCIWPIVFWKLQLLAERYLREVWPVVTKALKEVGIGCELNLVSSASYNRCCFDPGVVSVHIAAALQLADWQGSVHCRAAQCSGQYDRREVHSLVNHA